MLAAPFALCLAMPAFAQPASPEPPKRAGADVPVPQRTKTVAPVYPPEALAQGLRGIVILELTVSTEGKVTSVEVVRSVPPFDAAAVEAVRQWEYEVSKVEGKPVSVQLTVPISFAMRLPEATRQEGIPELRQGATPAYPASAQGGASVTARVTLDDEGRVAEAEVNSGDPPWAEALLRALRTWRFAVDSTRGVLSFRVQADFLPASGDQPPRVTLEMSGLQESQSFASRPEPAPLPSPSQSATPSAPGAVDRTQIASPAPEPTQAPVSPSATSPGPAAPPAVAPEAPRGVPESAAGATTARAESLERAAGGAAEPAAGTTTQAAPATAAPESPPAPPVEVITAPPPPVAALPPGVSAVLDVSLAEGVPDLVKGRRPVPPPFARMSGSTGTVTVRFSVDAGGQTALKESVGPALLQPAAEEAVRTWTFRRTTAVRLHLVAVFQYETDAATSLVTVEP